MKQCRKCSSYYSYYSNKYNEIKMCDLEPFSKIRSQFMCVISYLFHRYLTYGYLKEIDDIEPFQFVCCQQNTLEIPNWKTILESWILYQTFTNEVF